MIVIHDMDSLPRLAASRERRLERSARLARLADRSAGGPVLANGGPRHGGKFFSTVFVST